MEKLMQKYEQKLCTAGLAEEGEPLMGILDAELCWNRKNRHTALLEKIFQQMNINSILFSKPKEPYNSIINFLSRASNEAIYPEDCESRTFLHDLPIAADFSDTAIIPRLRNRKCVLIPGYGVIAFGTVSLEQAFITFSSVCFASFVKFFSDILHKKKKGLISLEESKFLDRIRRSLPQPVEHFSALSSAPFEAETEVLNALEEAGKKIVDYGLVDSYFGNISYCFHDTLYISQTGSSLDELAGCIDPCPLDGSSCAGITASSELSTHMEIIKTLGTKAILHGHPRFSVIISMDCDRYECPCRGFCHRKCPEIRNLADVPIVSGEVGTGPFGLCRTVPQAVEKARGAIVYGHGVFSTGKEDFNEAFLRMLAIENTSYKEYFRRFDA
ncbi:MAG: class II aldolase/adducin family protein [Syntrophales bacterium]|jgi:ribulose-5-phosphate 4-epimerase/fuculose-1-phosphate aldolase|nr:class II aldolase/adducin family protein [Syntrophales bacterium]MDY0044019.1 class II aldolase/adducin family protein [Syntrophales bacterium]